MWLFSSYESFIFFIYLSGSVRHEYLDQNFSLPVWRNAHNNWRSRSLSSRWMSHETYQLRACQALSLVRTLKIWMNRYATLLEDSLDNSHMCLTNDSYLILCIPTMNGHTNGWACWGPQSFTYSPCMCPYMEITCAPRPKTLLHVHISPIWKENPKILEP